MTSVYLKYFPSIRPLFATSETTEEYPETNRYVTFPFSMLFLCCYKTWHHYLYLAEATNID